MTLPMKPENASREATTNPQAYACLGVTVFAGFLGIFFGVFLTDLTLRLAMAAACFVAFVAGIGGHSYFKKQEASSSFRPSRAVRRALGFCFGLSILGALGFATFAVVSVNIGDAVVPVVYAIGIFPFVRSMLKDDETKG